MQGSNLDIQTKAPKTFHFLRISLQLYSPPHQPLTSSNLFQTMPTSCRLPHLARHHRPRRREALSLRVLPAPFSAPLLPLRRLPPALHLRAPLRPSRHRQDLSRPRSGQRKPYPSFSLLSLPDRYLLELSPSACLSKWSGEAERRLRGAFLEARRHAPSLLFFDELDAFSLDRGQTDDPGARRLLSELLIQLSALQRDDHVIVIAATNRIADIDPAVLRRFEKTIEVPLPTAEEREQMMVAMLRGVACEMEDDDLGSIAEATEGWSGSLLRVG